MLTKYTGQTCNWLITITERIGHEVIGGITIKDFKELLNPHKIKCFYEKFGGYPNGVYRTGMKLYFDADDQAVAAQLALSGIGSCCCNVVVNEL